MWNDLFAFLARKIYGNVFSQPYNVLLCSGIHSDCICHVFVPVLRKQICSTNTIVFIQGTGKVCMEIYINFFNVLRG